MANKRLRLFKDEIRDFCRQDCKSKVVSAKDDLIVLEADAPEDDMADRNGMAMGNLINEPGER
jgi:hypothetical protein